MSSIKFGILSTLALVIGAAPNTQAETLPEAMPCELALEKTASHLIFDLSLVLGQKNALSKDEFSGIRASLDALESNASSKAANSCFGSFPDQRRRYQQWMTRQASKVVHRAQERLNKTCARRTRLYISSHKRRVEEALGKKRIAKAARYASAMREGLASDPMLSRCQSTRAEVQSLLSQYIPNVENQAALPKVLEKLGKAYWTSHGLMEEGKAALLSSGRSLKPAPLSLEKERGQDALRLQLQLCRDYAKAALELGGTLEHAVAGADGQEHSLAQARSFCEESHAAADQHFAAFLAHNRAYHATVLKRWQRVSIKGWGMEKIFNANGRPMAEATLPGGAILWTYARPASCQQFRFSPRGKQVGDTQVACP